MEYDNGEAFRGNGELQGLTKRFVDKARADGMEVSIEKSRIATDTNADISMNSQKLEGATWGQQCTGKATARQKSACLSHGSNGHFKRNLAKQHHQLHRQVQVVQDNLLLSPSSAMAARQGPCLLTSRKGSWLSIPNFRGNLSASP